VKRSDLFSLLLTCLLTVGRRQAGAESLLLPASRWVTPVRLISVTTHHGPGVTLEYGPPCLAEAGNRLRKLVHNFGRQGFVLVQYKTPYAAPEGHCPDGTLLFLPEKEATTATP
jgi:hypothetical protein